MKNSKRKTADINPRTRTTLTKDGPFPHEVVAKEVTTMHDLRPPELCSAQYTATLVPVPDSGDEVIIQASGMHPTSGYAVFFQKSRIDIYPPEFSLWHVKPSGPTSDVISPFSKFTGFKASGRVKTVTVFDANGRHDISVQKIGGSIVMCD
jgi:hypothetical protein